MCEKGSKSKYTIAPMRKKHQNIRFQTTTCPQHGDKKCGKWGELVENKGEICLAENKGKICLARPARTQRAKILSLHPNVMFAHDKRQELSCVCFHPNDNPPPPISSPAVKTRQLGRQDQLRSVQQAWSAVHCNSREKGEGSSWCESEAGWGLGKLERPDLIFSH